MYSDSFIEELKSKINLSDVIGRRVSLKKTGRDFIGLCPFHKEKTPSFHVNDIKGFYHCFGCGKHGDIITFTMENEGLDFKTSIESLANDFGIPLPKLEAKKEDIQKKNEIDLIYEMNELACKFFESNIFMPFGKIGLEYAKKRGLTKENIKKFRIGFAVDDFSALLNYLKSKDYKETDIEKAGLIAGSNGKTYDKFRNRVMFPVIDKRGRVIAFTGRVVDDGMPKYMNSPETLIYHKGNTLFNYYFAKKAIYDEGYSILVEGNLDAISLSIYGIENVVAPMGTGITEAQVLELWKASNEIVVCLDGDSAGIKAAERLSELVLPHISADRKMKFITLPKNADPDDFVRNSGKQAFIDLCKNAINLSEYLWVKEIKKLKIKRKKPTAEDFVTLDNNLNKILLQIKSNGVKKNFQDYFKENIWKLKKISNSSSKDIAENYSTETNIDYRILVAKNYTQDKIYEYIINCEKEIISNILLAPNVIKNIFETYNIDIFSTDFLNVDVIKILSIFDNLDYDDKDFLKNITKMLEKEGFNSYIKSNVSYLYVFDENKIINIVYSLFLQRNIYLVELELKDAIHKNSSNEKIKLLEEQLNKLKIEKLNFDSKVDFI